MKIFFASSGRVLFTLVVALIAVAVGWQLWSYYMLEPWTALVLDDARVVHESTPIQPLGHYGHRDTLVLTYRARGFQGPAAR